MEYNYDASYQAWFCKHKRAECHPTEPSQNKQNMNKVTNFADIIACTKIASSATVKVNSIVGCTLLQKR